MNPVVVIGISHHNTLGIIRALGRTGLSSVMYPIVAGGRNNYVSKSKYIREENLTIIDGLDQLIDCLEHLSFPTDEKATVICGWDAAISLLDKNRERLEGRYIIPSATGKYGGIDDLMSKTLQIKAASESGLVAPRSICYSKTEASQSELDGWKDFPCIIKPVDSMAGAKTEIHICRCPSDLKRDISESSCQSFLVQPFIDKHIEFQLIGCSLEGGDEVIIPGYTNIIRQPANTNTGFLKFQPVDDVVSTDTLEAVKRFIRNIGYSGLFSVEFLKGKDGKDYFLEINMRNDGNAICVTDAGVNLPYIWYAYNSGLDYRSEMHKFCRSLYCMPEFDDIIFVLKGKLSLFKWIKDVRRTTSFMEYDKDDKAPFRKKTKGFIRFLIHRILHI